MISNPYDLTLDISSGEDTVPAIIIRRNDFLTCVWTVHVVQDGTPVDITGFNPVFECLTSTRKFIRDDGSEFGNITMTNPTTGTFEYVANGTVFGDAGLVSAAYFALEKPNQDYPNMRNRITTSNFAFNVIPDASNGVASNYISDIQSLLDIANKVKSQSDVLTYMYNHGSQHLTSGSDPIPLVNGTSDGLMPASLYNDIINGTIGGAEGQVVSVNGRQGIVTLTSTDVGLGAVDNTSDIDKPVSAATNTALNGKVDKVEGKGLSTNDYTTTEKNKLAGLPSSVIYPVTSVNGDTGDITVDKASIGLGAVNNTADIDKPISTATQSALDNKVDKVAGKGLSTNDFSNEYRDAIDGLSSGVAGVSTVNGRTGDVVLTSTDVGLGNVDNTADTDKPVSTATQTALDLKVDKVEGMGLSSNDYTSAEKTKLAGLPDTITSAVTSVNTQTGDVVLTKADIGLDLVDNTPDLSKPISTLTQAALDNKVTVVSGKGLSTNDYSDADRNKLAGLPDTITYPVTTVAGRTGDVVLTQSDVGLDQVDNTADMAKPISSPTQAALDLKVDLSTYTADQETINSRLEELEMSNEAVKLVPITPSDTTVISANSVGLYVGVAGNVAVTYSDGTTGTIPNLAAGIIHPISNLQKIMATSTTASSIMVAY